MQKEEYIHNQFKTETAVGNWTIKLDANKVSRSVKNKSLKVDLNECLYIYNEEGGLVGYMKQHIWESFTHTEEK